MIKCILLLFLISSVCINVVYSAPSSGNLASEIANNISDEYITCGSYFAVVAGSAENSNDKEVASSYKKAMEQVLDNAYLLAKVGRTEEMAQKVTLARLEISLSEMKESIDTDYSNISVLLNKYAKRCQWVMNNPEKLMSEWQKKIFKKYEME